MSQSALPDSPWETHERRIVLLSICLPHGGFHEEDHIAEFVMIIMEEGKKMGTEDFFISGDLNIELKLEGGKGEEFQGFDSLDWYGLCGPECKGSGEDLETYEKNLCSQRC